MEPSYIEYELESGEHVAMSTAPILLLKLRGSNKERYKSISKVMMKGMNEDDVMDLYQFLYDAYVCANQGEEVMSFMEFIENANTDFTYNGEIVNDLVGKEKKPDSEQPSKEQ